MAFWNLIGEKTIYLNLFTELEDKPILRNACYEVFHMACMDLVGIVGEQSERKEGEIEKSFTDILEDDELLTEIVAEYTNDSHEHDTEIMEDYGEEKAVELFIDRTGESLEILVAEYGNRNRTLAYHILKHHIEEIYTSTVWDFVVRHLIRYKEDDEYTSIRFIFES